MLNGEQKQIFHSAQQNLLVFMKFSLLNNEVLLAWC